MIVTADMIRYAQQQLLAAAQSCGGDPPGEILDQLDDLKEDLESLNRGNQISEEIDSDLDQQIDELLKLYS